MDGTLVDTEPYWMECEYALAEKYGGRWSYEDCMAVVGGDLLDSAAYMREHMGIDRTPLQIVEELLDDVIRDGRARDARGARGRASCSPALRAQDVPCALVTMSWRRFVVPVLEALPEGSFDALVCGDEVTQGKPHPEAYRRAAELLGVDPGDTLAIEDSPTGAASAEAAGCQVLIVPHHVPVPSGERTVHRDSLVGLGVDDLADLALNCPI